MKSKPSLKLEEDLWNKGYELVAGLDEVGYGAWAGPVVAGAVIWSTKEKVYKINDSKLLKAGLREDLALKIKDKAVAWGVGEGSVKEITDLGLARARNLAMTRALESLKIEPEYLIIDAVNLKWKGKPCLPIIKGDSKSITIAAASIIAKVHRDKLMTEMHQEYGNYGFDKHKGYGTKAHQENISKYGLCLQHRSNYKCFQEPVMQLKLGL